MTETTEKNNRETTEKNNRETSGIPGGYRLVSTYDLPVFQFGGGKPE